LVAWDGAAMPFSEPPVRFRAGMPPNRCQAYLWWCDIGRAMQRALNALVGLFFASRLRE